MKIAARLTIFALSFLYVLVNAHGQTMIGQNDISMSYGLISGRQIADNFNGFGEKKGGYYESGNTGNIFITWRHFISNRVSLGITAGTQTIWGSYFNYDGVFQSKYKWTNKTGSLEMTIDYVNRQYFQFYTLLGAGVSAGNQIDYSTTGYIPGPAKTIGYNFQYCPVAIRFGRKVFVSMEVGAGYKGFVNAGVTYSMYSSKHKPHKFDIPVKDQNPVFDIDQHGEVILLPADFPVLGLEGVHILRNNKRANDSSCDFNDQVNEILSKVRNKGGNIFKLRTIDDPRGCNCLYMTGDAGFSSDSDLLKTLKTRVLEEKTKKFKKGPCAYLTIYRTHYNYARSGSHHNRLAKTGFAINGIAEKMIRAEKFKCCLTKEGACKITLENSNETITIDAKFGNDYYVEIFNDYNVVNKRGKGLYHIKSVDNAQGALVCSTMRRHTNVKEVD